MASIPGVLRSPGGRNGNPIFLPGKLYEQRSLVGYSQKDWKEADMTERLGTHDNTPFSPMKFEDKGTFTILFPIENK